MKVKTSELIAFLFIFSLVIYGVYLSRTDLSYFDGFYVREDGPLEWLTVVALAASSFFCFYRSRILAPFRDRIFILSLVGMGFILLFGVGEEISWGQRIFGWQSPEFFVANNSQQETNFHNFIIGDFKVNRMIFGKFLGVIVVFCITLFPFLYKKVELVKRLVNKFAVPVPHLFHCVAYILLIALAEAVAGGKKGEILEFGGCWIFMLILLRPVNREMFSRKSFER